MSHRVTFWDSTDAKLSVGSADMPQVPAVGDEVTLRSATLTYKLKVESRRFQADNIDDEPSPKATVAEVHLLVEVVSSI